MALEPQESDRPHLKQGIQIEIQYFELPVDNMGLFNFFFFYWKLNIAHEGLTIYVIKIVTILTGFGKL